MNPGQAPMAPLPFDGSVGPTSMARPAGPPGGSFGPPPPSPFIHAPPQNWLPPGWTEHKAPDGMSYYYNATSGQSSWIRPAMAPPLNVPGMPQHSVAPLLQQPPPGVPGYSVSQQPLYPPGVAPPTALMATANASASAAGAHDAPSKTKAHKKSKKEKAVKKTQILESPWFIVVTNLENTFFYNKETKISIWAPTPELQQILARMGQVETERLEADRRANDAALEQERQQALKRSNENESSAESEKRARSEAVGSAADGTEMNEDDVAWQLAMMDGDQDHDMDSLDEGEDEEDEVMNERLRMLQGSQSSSSKQPHSQIAPSLLEISPHNIQEREMAFLEMMRDRGVTPFDTWEKAMAKIERDVRMRLIPDKKAREVLFDSFCVIRAQELKDAKEETRAREEIKESGRGEKEKRPRGSISTSVSSSSSKPEDVYRRLVEDYTTKTSTWLDFMTKYRIDPKFLGLKPGSLRESIFRQYLSDLKKGIIQPKGRDSGVDKVSSSSSRSSSSRKYKATEKELEEFMSLLRETKKDILHEHKHSSSVEWRKIKKLIDRDRRYDAVGSSTERELLFRDYADRVIQRRD